MAEEDESNIANGCANMSGQELKPCPFCGDRLEWCTGLRGFTHSYDPFCVASDVLMIGEADIERWNTRTPDPMLEELAGALERISEDGNAMMGMTVGSRNILLSAMQKYQQSKVQP